MSPRLVTRTLTRTRKLPLSELVVSFVLRSRRMSNPETSERAHYSISNETTILRTNADEKRNVFFHFSVRRAHRAMRVTRFSLPLTVPRLPS